jgi:hypothetical protein
MPFGVGLDLMQEFVSGALPGHGCIGVSNSLESCSAHTHIHALSDIFISSNMHEHGLCCNLQYSNDGIHTNNALHVEVDCFQMHVEFQGCSSPMMSTTPRQHVGCHMVDLVGNQNGTHASIL